MDRLLILAVVLSGTTALGAGDHAAESTGFTSSKRVFPGKPQAYRIELGGDELRQACDVIVRAVLPDGGELIATTGEPARLSGGVLEWPTVASLPAGESIVQEVELRRGIATDGLPEPAELCFEATFRSCGRGAARQRLGPRCVSVEVDDDDRQAARESLVTRFEWSAAAACAAASEPIHVRLDAGATRFPPGVAASSWQWTVPPGHELIGTGPRVEWIVPAGQLLAPDVTLEVTGSNGDVDRASAVVPLQGPPVVSIRAIPHERCSATNSAVQLFLDATATSFPSGATPVRWTWTLPSGHTQTGAGPIIQWIVPPGASGPQTAHLAVRDSDGCVGFGSVVVELHPLPEVAIDLDPPALCDDPAAAQIVALDGTGTTFAAGQSGAAWDWTPTVGSIVGSGSTVSWVIPAGTASAATVSLTVEDSRGCRGTGQTDLPVFVPPRPAAAAVPASSCIDPADPAVVHLDGLATVLAPSATASYTWVVPVGTIAGTGAVVDWTIPAPAYAPLGPIGLKLVVDDSQGCRASIDLPIEISARPQVDLIATPSALCATGTDLRVVLDGSGSTFPSATNPVDWDWIVPVGHVVGTGPVVDWWIPAGTTGTITARLDLADDAGCGQSGTVSVAISPTPLASLTVTVADAGSATRFAGSATGGTVPLSFAWNFGDGATGAGQLATHVYASGGVFAAQLTVTDANACVATVGQPVAIPAVLRGAVAASAVCLGGPSTFTAQSVSGGTGPLSFQWDFGDGQTLATTVPVATHAYGAGGRYPVVLTIVGSTGDSGPLTTDATVIAPPDVIVTSTGLATAGAAQTFAVSSPSPLGRIDWTFSDGHSATGTTVSHTFATGGRVTAEAVAASLDGCPGVGQFELELATGESTVSIAKSARPTTVEPGGEVEYTLILRGGAGPLVDVAIEDSPPAGFDYRRGSATLDGAPIPDPSGLLPLTFGGLSLPPDGTAVVRYRMRVEPDTPPGDYDNVVHVAATDGAGRRLDDGPRSASVRVEEEPSSGQVALRIRKSGQAAPDPPEPGGLVRYRLEVSNVGTTVATQVRVVDDYPEQLSSVEENDDAGVVLDGRIEWLVRELPPGAIRGLHYALRLNGDLASGVQIDNFALVAAAQDECCPQDNRAGVSFVVGGAPDLILAKSVTTDPDPATAGAQATYQLTWSNAGPGQAPAAVIVDDYDESKLELTNLPPGATDAGGILTIELGDLAAGAAGTFTYAAAVREGAQGAIVNQARITSSVADRAPDSNVASARFDVVLFPAQLSLIARAEPVRRCVEPQVELAVRSDRYDAAAALDAARALLDAADRLERAGRDGAWSVGLLPRLIGDLRALGRGNVEAIYLQSGMGVRMALDDSSAHVSAAFDPASDVLPIVAPFGGGAASLDPSGTGWTMSGAPRPVSLAGVGHGLAALAATVGTATVAGSGAGRVPLLVAIADRSLAWLRDPCAAQVGAADSHVGPGELASAPSREVAAVLLGAARLIAAKGAFGPDFEGMVATAEALHREAQAVLARRIAAHRAFGEDGRIEAATVGAIAAGFGASVEAGLTVGPDVADAVRTALTALRAVDDGRYAEVVDGAGQRGECTLDAQLAGLGAELALGDLAAARRSFERLEAGYLDGRFGIYRSVDPARAVEGGAIVYTPQTLGATVGLLSALTVGAAPADAARLVTRIDRTLEVVALAAGLQGEPGPVVDDGAGQDAGRELRLVLGGSGTQLAIAGSTGARVPPVLLERVSFGGVGRHPGGSGVRDAGLDIALAGASSSRRMSPSTDCQTATVQLLDRRFVVDSALQAIAGIEAAGRSLVEAGTARRELAVERLGTSLLETAHGDRFGFGFLGQLGVPLRFAPGMGTAAAYDAMLTRFARAAGLSRVPQPLVPTWIELDAGDPAFTGVIDPADPYGYGWHPASFAEGISPRTLGRALIGDVTFASAALERGTALDRFLGMVRLRAATSKVEFIGREVAEAGALHGWQPVFDAERRPVELRRDGRGADLGGHAVILEGLARYLGLAAALQGAAPAAGTAAGEVVPLAPEVGAAAAARLVALVEKEAGRDLPAVDLLAAADALVAAEAAGVEPAQGHSSKSTESPRQIAERIVAGAPSREPSPLVDAAVRLLAAARYDLGRPVVETLYDRLIDGHFDAEWQVFASGVAERDGGAFVLTDLDVGLTLSGIAAALPQLGPTRAADALAKLRGSIPRLILDSGLQRQQEYTAIVDGAPLRAPVPQVARAIRFAVADGRPAGAQLYPGDLLRIELELVNPVDSSTTVDTFATIDLGPGLREVAGSTRVGGQVAAGAARVPLDRLGGGERQQITLLVEVVPGAAPGAHRIGVGGVAQSMPGAGGVAIAATPIDLPIEVAAFGAIAGAVYFDVDGNGQRDPGEAGFPHVTVTLDDGTTVVTSADGGFAVAETQAGTYAVQIDPASLPSGLASATERRRVRVVAAQTSQVELPLSVRADITGIVYRDVDGDRRRGPAEPTVAGVVVRTGAGQTTVSDRHGRYLLRAVAPGSHQLLIDRRQPYLRDPLDLRLEPVPLPPVERGPAAPPAAQLEARAQPLTEPTAAADRLNGTR